LKALTAWPYPFARTAWLSWIAGRSRWNSRGGQMKWRVRDAEALQGQDWPENCQILGFRSESKRRDRPRGDICRDDCAVCFRHFCRHRASGVLLFIARNAAVCSRQFPSQRLAVAEGKGIRGPRLPVRRDCDTGRDRAETLRIGSAPEGFGPDKSPCTLTSGTLTSAR
jgi:hypothetical protein